MDITVEANNFKCFSYNQKAGEVIYLFHDTTKSCQEESGNSCMLRVDVCNSIIDAFFLTIGTENIFLYVLPKHAIFDRIYFNLFSLLLNPTES